MVLPLSMGGGGLFEVSCVPMKKGGFDYFPCKVIILSTSHGGGELIYPHPWGGEIIGVRKIGRMQGIPSHGQVGFIHGGGDPLHPSFEKKRE